VFAADDGVVGVELWKTDGTEAGTVLIKDVYPGLDTSLPQVGFLKVLGNSALFEATDGVAGYELWKTDGTAAGTVMVKDIAPGPGSSHPSVGPGSSAVVGDIVYLTAQTTTTGFELWRTDGTTAGTALIEDINPGPGQGAGGAMVAIRGEVYFAGNDGTTGAEPWRLFFTPPPTLVSATPASVTAGSPLTATWSGIAGPAAQDWVGLYASSTDADPALVAWTYTGGTADGTLELTVPLGATPGTTYELRLFSNNAYTRLATSTPFSVTASATTIAATPASVAAGSAVTATWSGVASPSATDWVGLYANSSDPEPALLAWAYTGGTAAGSVNLTVPSGATTGVAYELRLFTNNTYTRLATSAPFSVTASTTAISAAPLSVNAGGTVTATYSDIASPSATDWVGLYASGSDPEPALVAWAYTNGTAAGTLNLTVPVSSPSGSSYELRLFTNNTYTRLATSNSFSVVASAAAISASPASVAAGGSITATWSGIGNPSPTDWIGLYASSGAPDTAIVEEVGPQGAAGAWVYTGGAAAGSINLTVPPSAAPGTTYELRLFSNNSYTRLATSAPFEVT
jgi:ELWxxDGT repeat protein